MTFVCSAKCIMTRSASQRWRLNQTAPFGNFWKHHFQRKFGSFPVFHAILMSNTEIVLFKKSIPWLVYITWPWRWEGSGSRARKSRREHLIEIEVGGDPSWGCWRWNLLTLADEVLERHGAAVEEQAGTECRIDTGGEGGGGGEEGGRGRRWGNVVDTNVLLEAWGSDRTGFSRQETNVSEISVWGEFF